MAGQVGLPMGNASRSTLLPVEEATYQIFAVSADGGRPQPLTVGPADKCRAKLVDRWMDLLRIQS